MLSQQSRMRLLRLINRMNLSKFTHNTMITLTYPDDSDFLKYKTRSQQRFEFLRAIERQQGRQLATLWRQEYQPRKTGTRKGELVPHFHIMVFDAPYIPAKDVKELWAGILDYGGNVAVHLTAVKGAESAARYLAKYMSKQCTLDISTYRHNGLQFGRHWGITRPALIPMHPIRAARELDQVEVDNLKEWQRQRMPEGQPPTSGGFTALGKDVADIAIALLDLDVAGRTQ